MASLSQELYVNDDGQRKNQLDGLFQQISSQVDITELKNSLMKDENYDQIVLKLEQDLPGAKFKLLKAVLDSEKLKKWKEIGKKRISISEIKMKLKILFKDPEIKHDISELMDALLNHLNYEQILARYNDQFLGREMKIIDKILKSNQLKSLLFQNMKSKDQNAVQEKNQCLQKKKELSNIFADVKGDTNKLQELIILGNKKEIEAQIEKLSEEMTGKNYQILKNVLISSSYINFLKKYESNNQRQIKIKSLFCGINFQITELIEALVKNNSIQPILQLYQEKLNGRQFQSIKAIIDSDQFKRAIQPFNEKVDEKSFLFDEIFKEINTDIKALKQAVLKNEPIEDILKIYEEERKGADFKKLKTIINSDKFKKQFCSNESSVKINSLLDIAKNKFSTEYENAMKGSEFKSFIKFINSNQVKNIVGIPQEKNEKEKLIQQFISKGVKINIVNLVDCLIQGRPYKQQLQTLTEDATGRQKNIILGIIQEFLKSNKVKNNPQIKDNFKNDITKEIQRKKKFRQKDKIQTVEISNHFYQEKLEAEIHDFRKSYKSFDQEMVANLIKSGYKLNESFHLQVPRELKFVTRKHIGIHEDLTMLCYDLIDKKADDKTRLLLSQTVKYSIKKGSNIEFELLINLLKSSDNEEIKSEITYALGYKIKNCKDLLREDVVKEIKQFISYDIKAQAKSFLHNQIEKHQGITLGNDWKINYGKINISKNSSTNKQRAVVTKNRHVIKTNYKNSQSEESSVNILSLADALKNRNKKIQIDSNAQNIPIFPSGGGDDRSMWNGTYVNVKNLYQKAISNQLLKIDDKDNYLVSKLIDNTKWYTGGFLGSLITDRMIVATFLEISSRKQNRQLLNQLAINKLVMLCDKFYKVRKLICGDKKDANLVNIIHVQWKPSKDLNLIEKSLQGIKEIFEKQKSNHYYFSISHDGAAYNYYNLNCYGNRNAEIIYQVSRIIDNSLEQLRVDALKAVYHSSASIQGKCLTKKHIQQIQSCIDDHNQEFKKYVIKILSTLADSKEVNYSKLFQACLEQFERKIDLEQSISYINQQTKDPKRCKDLFDEKTILRISNLLKKNTFDNKTKLYCCEIINNCLGYSFINELGMEELKNCTYIIQNVPLDHQLKGEAIKSILLSTEKGKKLPQQIVDCLMRNFHNFDDTSANFVIMILGAICEKMEIQNVNYLSSKLSDDRVIVSEEDDIKFEQWSKDKIGQSSISSIVSKIFVISLQNGTKISEQSIKSLISALESNDKQTRILSAKSLSLAANNNVIENMSLVQLREYTQDKVPDIAIFITIAYTKGLARLSQDQTALCASHLQFLVEIYAFEDLRLGDENFTSQVNKNILSVLLNEANKQEFDEKLFRIFDHILFLDEAYIKEAVNILECYTNKKYKIPQNTILALENAFGKPDVSVKTINVLENVIRNGQSVGEKILQIFCDNLYLSEDKNLRQKSFELLNIADHNQDLSDEIFDKVELERAGYVIENQLADKQLSINYLNKKTDEGQRLPISTFEALRKEIENNKVLPILINISNNKQNIPNYLIEKLTLMFDPKQKKLQLVKLFANIVRNNQDISPGLLTKFEKALDNKIISDQILSIFTYRAQKGQRLSKVVINRICNKFLTTHDKLIKQELSSAISSIIQKIIQKENKYDLELIKKVLIHGLNDQNQSIVNDCVNGYNLLSYQIKLDKISIDALIKKMSCLDCAQDTRQNISSTLKYVQLTNNQQIKLQLLNLNSDSHERLLNKISKICGEFDILQQNFKQIQGIIDRDPQLQNKAIDILLKCINKQDIPDELINSLATLMTSTNSPKLKTSCIKLIGQIAKTGKTITDTVIAIIANEEDHKLVKHTLEIIVKNQNISGQANLLLKIDNIRSKISGKDLTKLLKYITKQLENGVKLTEQCVKKLLLVKDGNKYNTEIKQFANIFSYTLLQQQPKYEFNQKIVKVIEQAIICKKINTNILRSYVKIIQAKSYTNLKEIIEKLAELILKNSNSDQLNLEILVCISSASQVEKIPEQGIMILQNNLDSENEIIRSLSFKGLRASQQKGYDSEKFKQWCNGVIINLEQNINVKVKPDLELLEILASLRYVDLSKIIKKPQHQWARQFLLSDLLARFNINQGQKFSLYRNWVDLQQLKQFQQGKSDKILKCLHHQSKNKMSFDQLNDIIKFLPNVDFKTAYNILKSSKDLSKDLKQESLKLLLHKLTQNREINLEFLDKLAYNISTRFSIIIANKLLHSISRIENIREFQLLLDFAEANKIKVSDIYVQNVTIDELKRSLEIKLLGNLIQGSVDRYILANAIDRLLDKKWTFQQLKTIFQCLKSSNHKERAAKEKKLILVIVILDEYKLSPTNYKNVLAALDKNLDEWLIELNKIAIENNFQTLGKVKNTIELISQLKTNNGGNSSLQKLIESNLEDQVENVKSNKFKSSIERSELISKIYNEIQNIDLIRSDKIFKEASNFLLSIKKNVQQSAAEFISDWTKDDIYLWANIIKSNPDHYFSKYSFNIEALAVIKRANFLETGFHMTDSQILSCIVALNAHQTHGRLLQVATGEGKSTIVSVLAIIYALKGKKVDIITSSPVLAERDAKEKVKLYNMFGLSCSDNNDKSIYIKGEKGCYKNDIVYGQAAQFQFDVLRDEYSQLGTLAGRKCEVAIVDEVDSMLIDDSSKIARLATTVAGLDQLQPIYYFLWLRLIYFQERIIEIDGKMYQLYGKINYVQDKIKLEYSDEKGEIIQIPDLKSYIKQTEDISNIGQPIQGEIQVFLKKHLQDFLNGLINKNDIKIMSNFKQFVKKQTQKWINNAIVAFNYQENIHYIVQDGVIKPVDYNSTGIVQSSTNWSDGLHQFLQIKHSLKMTSQTFTTNFLSNMGYFKRYGKNLFGLTGTLGSKKAQKVLSNVYKVDLVKIPNLRKKQYLELSTVVATNDSKWLNEICSSAINEANKRRGVLIICQTIQHTKRISQKLREQYRAGAIKLYTMNNINQQREVEKIVAGEIIIATNLAGRGTDIKTEDIEQNGGLHVIVTFMPSNERVEEQAFGRTARQGKRGTGQMILNSVNLIEYGEVTPHKVKELRNNFQQKMLDEFQNKELIVIDTKDRLFNQFCSLLNNIRQDIRRNSSTWTKLKNIGKDIFVNVIPSADETNLLSAIEEQWAMFLRNVEDGVISIKDAFKQYKKFADKINQDYKNKTVIKNPYYLIAIGNDLVINDSSLNCKYEQAMSYFNKAINLDKQYSAAAYVGIGWLLLKGKQNIYLDNDQSKNYKHQAIKQFENALIVLNVEMASLNALQLVLQQLHIDIKSDLSKQLIQKINILGSYSNSVQKAVSIIKKSLRLIDITGIEKYQNTFPYESNSGEKINRKDYSTQFSKVQTYYEGLTRNINGQNLGQCDQYQVVFNDLTVREDSGIIDQAVNTINNAFQKKKQQQKRIFGQFKIISKSSAVLDEKYQDICIYIKQIHAEKLRTILNPNIQIKEATKEIAIAQLKENSSLFQRLLPEGWSSDSKINLEIILNNEKLETHTNIKARDALKITEAQKDKNLLFNLTIFNSNKVSKFLQKDIFPNSILSIEFIRLDWKNVRNKSQQIKCKTITLEITGNKDELIKAIDEPFIKTVQFFNSKNISVSFYKDKARQQISKMKEDNLCIRIENLNLQNSNKIINLCENSSFNINFIGVNPVDSLQGLKDGEINVNFDKLGKKESIELIPLIRKENIDFCLIFKHIDLKQVEKIIQKSSIDEERIEISKVKNLNELFMEEARPNLELSQFAARGIQYLLEINEKGFVPWSSIITVGILAGIQMAAGGILIATGFGSTVGMGLITEGAVDIFTAYRAYSTRQFNWSDYGKQKAVSLVISAASMGLQGMKDAGKGIQNIVVGVEKEALEQVGARAITNGKAIGATLLSTGKNLKSFAFAQIGVGIGEAGLREGLNKVADKLSHFALQQFKPQISSTIQNKVNNKFCQSNLMSLVRKMHALDNMNKSQNLKGKIDKILAQIINPQHNFWKKQWDSVGGPLCKGILSSQSCLSSPFSMALRVIGTLNGLYQITFIIDNIHDQLVKKLSQIDKEMLSMPQLLHQYCKINQKDSREIVQILKKQDIIQLEEKCNTSSLIKAFHHVKNLTLEQENPLQFHCQYLNPLAFDMQNQLKLGINQLSQERFQQTQQKFRYNKMPKTTIYKINLEAHNKRKDTVIYFCKLLHENTLSIEIADLSEIMKSVSDIITDQVIRVTESQLISPWSSYGMGALTSSISSTIQDKLIRNSQLGQQILSEKQKLLENLLNDPNSNPNDIANIKRSIQGKQTYAGLINHQAKKYTIAYSQCENIYYAQQKKQKNSNKKNPISSQVKKHAEQVKKDKPADIADMFTIASQNGLDIKIVDDQNYELTEEDKIKGTNIIVFSRGNKDQQGKDKIGHYQLLGQDGKIIEIKSDGNNCGYAVFAELTGKSIKQLRNQTAQGIQANSHNFSKALQAQNWIQSHYPKQANSLLFKGGARVKLTKQIQELVEAVKNQNPKLDKKRRLIKKKCIEGKLIEQVEQIDLNEVFQGQDFGDLYMYGASAISFHAQGTQYQDQFRQISDLNMMAFSPQQFEKWKHADPDKFEPTHTTTNDDGAQTLHGFYNLKLSNGQQRHIAMKVYHPNPNAYPNYLDQIQYTNIAGVKVLTLQSLKMMKTIENPDQALSENHKLKTYYRDDDPLTYVIRKNQFKPSFTQDNREEKDIKSIQMINKLIQNQNSNYQNDQPQLIDYNPVQEDTTHVNQKHNIENEIWVSSLFSIGTISLCLNVNIGNNVNNVNNVNIMKPKQRQNNCESNQEQIETQNQLDDGQREEGTI